MEGTPRGKSCWVRGLSQRKEHGFLLAFSDAAPALWATEDPSETAEESKVQSGQGGSPELTRQKVAEPGLSHSNVRATQAGGWSSRPCLGARGFRYLLGHGVTSSKSLGTPRPTLLTCRVQSPPFPPCPNPGCRMGA